MALFISYHIQPTLHALKCSVPVELIRLRTSKIPRQAGREYTFKLFPGANRTLWEVYLPKHGFKFECKKGDFMEP